MTARRHPTIRAVPAGDTPPRSSRPAGLGGGLERLRYLAGRGFVLSLFVVTLLLTLALSAPGAAVAGPIDDAKCAPTDAFQYNDPETAPAGVESFLPPQSGGAWMVTAGPLSPNNTPNEITGVRGMSWSGTTWYAQSELGPGAGPERMCSIQAQIANTLAKNTFDASRAMGSATISLRQMSNQATLFLELLHQIVPAMVTLRDQLFLPAMSIMFALLGLWVIVGVQRNDLRQTFRSVGGSLIAALFVALLLLPSPAGIGATNARSVPIAADDPLFYRITLAMANFSHDASEALTTAILVKPDSKLCQLPADAASRGTRLVDCSIWESMIFRPWAQGQFGAALSDAQDKAAQGKGPLSFVTAKGIPGKEAQQPQVGQDVRLMQIRAQAYAGVNDKAPLWQPGSCGEKVECDFNGDTKHGLFNQVRAFMWQNHRGSGAFDVWAGVNPDSRFSVAVGAIVANGLTLFYIGVTSILVMLWSAAPILLGFMLPLVGLAAILPSMQKHLRSWTQTWVKSGVLSFAFHIAQALSLLMVSLILNMSTLSLGWKCLLMLVLVITMFRVLKAIREDAVTPNLGGDPSTFDAESQLSTGRAMLGGVAGTAVSRGARVPGRMVKRAGAKAAKVGAGAALGGAAGALTAARTSEFRRRRLAAGLAGKDAAAVARKAAQAKSRGVTGRDRIAAMKAGHKEVRAARRDAQVAERDRLNRQRFPDGAPTGKAAITRARMSGVASATRTAAGSTLRGAAAGAGADWNKKSAVRAGSVANTGASDRTMRVARRAAQVKAREERIAARNAAPGGTSGKSTSTKSAGKSTSSGQGRRSTAGSSGGGAGRGGNTRAREATVKKQARSAGPTSNPSSAGSGALTRAEQVAQRRAQVAARRRQSAGRR